MVNVKENAYQIFDSMDRPCSIEVHRERDLYDELAELQEESELHDYRLTYAIGLIRPDGSITFDF